MGRTSGGYTIVEVMVVLAITVLLFTSALVLLNGQEGETQSTQTMQDISSKIQSYVAEINAGSYPGTENYYCQVQDQNGQPTPTLTYGSGDSEGCIYLGRAIEVEKNSGTIYSYIILGTRDSYTNGADNLQLATTLDQANPTPALTENSGTPTLVLVDSYTLEGGATVACSNITGSSCSSSSEYDLVSIYNQPDNSINNGSGDTILGMQAYPYVAANYPYPESSQLTTCLEELDSPSLNCSPANVVTTSQWSLCIDAGGYYEAVDVSANAGGVSTTLQECSQ